METEFNLSEKIYKIALGAEQPKNSIDLEDVKEFIRLLKENVDYRLKINPHARLTNIRFIAFREFMDELAGDKLI